jgi:uncharacterized membrane protein YccC
MAHASTVRPCETSTDLPNMKDEMIRLHTLLSRFGAVRARLRGRLLAIVQTAAAAVVAWYLAVLLLPDPRPAFAAIAAVIAVGATHGQQAKRAVQLVGGVVLGITVADIIIQLIGTGAWQMGVLVILAMGAAVALGGGELVVVEAGVSAILLVALDPGAAAGFQVSRIFEGVIGGATALAVSALFFPPDPALAPSRAAQAMFVERRCAGVARRRRRRARAHRRPWHRSADPLRRGGAGERPRDGPLHAAAPLVALPARPLRAQHPADRLRGPQHARARTQRGLGRARQRGRPGEPA